MLRKKFGMIVLILITTIALALPVVRADNETEISTDQNQSTTTENTQSNDATTDDSSNDQDVATTTMTEENFKQHDVYLTGDDITIDYVIDGNLFVIANNVTINSQIGGDAFICANTITVGEQGYVFSNLFAVSSNVNIKGVVYDLYILSNDVNITGYIYRDIRVSTKNLNIFGTVGRNAFIKSNNIKFAEDSDSTNTEDSSSITNRGIINGNLEYTSPNDLNISEEFVTGEIKYNQPSSNNYTVQNYLISIGTLLATVILIWLICLWIAPKFVKRTNIINKKNILPSIGLGILAPIILAIVSIILLLIQITMSFGLLLLGLLFLLMGISTSIFIIAINNLICNKLKIQKTIGNFGMLIVTSIILWAISLIPYVGGIVGIIAIIIGMGIIIYNLIIKEKELKVNTDNTENK